MAAALGFLLGTGVSALGGYAREKVAQKEQQKTAHDQILLDMYQKNPQLAMSPEGQKTISKTWGPDVAEGFMHLGTMAQQAQKQYAGAFGAPSAPAGANGAPMAAKPPAGAAAPSEGAPAQTDPAQLQEQISKGEAFLAGPYAQSLPKNTIAVAQAHLASLRQQLSHQQTEQDTNARFQQTKQLQQQNEAENRKDREQFHADTEADRAQNRAMMASVHAETLALQEQNKQFMEQMARERNADQRQAHFQSATQNLSAQTANIAKLLSAATPANPRTVKALLDQRNATARAMARQAKRYGLDYDSEAFKPLTVEQVPGWLASHTGGLIGGSTPTVTEASPSAPASAAPQGRPVKDKSGKVIGYTTDGKTMTPAE